MKANRMPVGLLLWSLLGVLYGLMLLGIAVFTFVGKSMFVLVHQVSDFRVYVSGFVFFALGTSYIISGLGLFRRKYWAIKLFFVGFLTDIWLGIWNDLMSPVKYEVTSPGLEDFTEPLFALVILLVCLWYSRRKHVRQYLTAWPN